MATTRRGYPMADREHRCPGCGVLVPHRMLACKTDWWRLPAPQRDRVTATYAQRRRQPTDPAKIRAHREALQAALKWYRDNTEATP